MKYPLADINSKLNRTYGVVHGNLSSWKLSRENHSFLKRKYYMLTTASVDKPLLIPKAVSSTENFYYRHDPVSQTS